MNSVEFNEQVGGYIPKGSKATIEVCLEYTHQGKKWALNFFAESLEDAENKVQSIKDNLILLGPLEMSIPNKSPNTPLHRGEASGASDS